LSIFRLRASPAVIAVATIPLWLSIMDTTILNVAYDDIVSSLGATLDEVSWASTAYILSSVAMLPLTGWLVARFGRKKLFMLMLAVFGAGSLLCGLATTASQLGAFRVLQGIGGGLLGAVSQTVLMDAYPPEERQDAINLLAVLSMIAPVMGPIVGGFVLERFSWPMLFFLNVPLAVFAIWLAMGIDIDQKAKSVPGRFSFTTIGLLFATLFALQFVLQSGDRLDWFDSAEIRWSLLAALVFGGLLVAQQLRAKLPMIDLRLFLNREFLIGNLMSFFAGASNYGVAFVGPLFLQQVLGFSPLQTAIMTIPATIGLLVGNRVQDYLSRRIAVYWVVSGGMILLAVALWYNGVYADFNDFTSITWLRIIQGIAFGVFVVPTGVFAFKTVKQNQIDAASGLFGVIRQESGMIGIALIATLLEASQNRYVQELLLQVPRWPTMLHRGAPSRDAILAALDRHAFVLGYQHVFAVSAAIMCAAGIAIALYGLWDRLGQPLRNQAAGDLA
jgi:MFS transporter, DHA2 family, multidrug resistance protein